MDNGDYYATFVIPQDFTKSSISNNPAKIGVTINEGKNAMVTSMLTQFVNQINQNDILNITTINETSNYGVKAMLLPMIFILLTFITSVATSFMISQNIKIDNKKGKSSLVQLLYIAILSLVIGFSASSLVIGITNVDIPIINSALYLSLISFSLMVFTVGSINLFGKKGMLLTVLLFILGMGLLQIPYEFLPKFYQILVASWEPLYYIGIGMRETLFQGYSAINSAIWPILILIIIGIIFAIINIFRKQKILTTEI